MRHQRTVERLLLCGCTKGKGAEVIVIVTGEKLLNVA